MFTNLIFDWSGTLVDDFHPTLHATNHVFAHHAIPVLSAEEFRENFRLPYPDFYEDYLPGKDLEGLETLFKAAFLTVEEGVRPLEPTVAFLDLARSQGVRLFVLTSMNREAFERQALAFGLLDYFEETYAGVIDKCVVMGQILQRHGLGVRDTAYVGDMVHDVEAAKAGGITSVAVLSGYDSPARLAAARPDFILHDVGYLASLLEACLTPSVQEDIVIRRLRVETRIGITVAERAKPQWVTLTVGMEKSGRLRGLNDEIANTVDYFAVSERLKALSAEGERNLIETLAEDLAMMVKNEFRVRRVKVLVEKPILANCEGVVVEVVR